MNRYIVRAGMNATDLGELDVLNFDTNTHITCIYPPVECDYDKMDEIINTINDNPIEIRQTENGFETECMEILTWIDGECNCLCDLL